MKLTLQGKYNSAVVMTDFVEQEAIGQIITICSQEMFKDSQIRVMPDCHLGKGCVVGFTARVKDRISPNLVGSDISCSVSAHKIDKKDINFERLDAIIREHVPSGMSFRSNISKMVDRKFEAKIKSVVKEIGDMEDINRHLCSIGSLGGGNHFIEVDRDDDSLWLLVHCGSRNFGQKICNFHQKKADKAYNEKLSVLRAGNRDDRQSVESLKLHPDFRYLEDAALDKYIEHMVVAQEFAALNHQVIAHEICSRMGWSIVESIFTNHNYLEFLGKREMIIRKGAVSAKKNERLVIPLNMRDGTLICQGKGNSDWNFSAPHGAGRVLARSIAKKELTLEKFQEEMKGIWTTSVCRGTLDESPMAYKDMGLIVDAIGETVDIVKRIVPVYNFKAV